MTTGFDLDEIERELMLDDLSWWRMNRVTKAGHAAITTILTEIRELRAENARLSSFAGSLEIQGPDDDDLIWLVLRGNDIPTGGQAMVCLGGATPGIMGQLATAIEQDRRAALGEPQ